MNKNIILLIGNNLTFQQTPHVYLQNSAIDFSCFIDFVYVPAKVTRIIVTNIRILPNSIGGVL